MNKREQESKKKARIAAILAAVLLAGAGAWTVAEKNSGSHSGKIPLLLTNASYLEISPAFPKEALELYLESKEGVSDISMTPAGSFMRADLLPPPTSPYVLKATIEPQPDSYRDLTVRVDRKKSSIIFVADGFTPSDTISMTLNEEESYRNVPFDWSGKMELEESLPQTLPARICVSIRTKEKPLDVCHVVQKGAAA